VPGLRRPSRRLATCEAVPIRCFFVYYADKLTIIPEKPRQIDRVFVQPPRFLCKRQFLCKAPGVGPDQGADRRAAAALVLGEIGSARSAVPILIEAASHPNWRVRRVAVRHLAALRPYGPAVLQALRGVADRDDAYPVRDLAAQALDDR